MKVRCIDNSGVYISLPITEGKIYPVIDVIRECYVIVNDNGVEWSYSKRRFEEVKEVEKERVLEVEFKEVFDKVAWRITYQNEDVLSRDFEDREIGVKNVGAPFFDYNGLCLKGRNEQGDDRILLVDKEEAEIIKQRVDAINEKYGIPKRWRAKKGEKYWYIDSTLKVRQMIDYHWDADDLMHEIGNYFRTEDDCEDKLEKIRLVFKGE